MSDRENEKIRVLFPYVEAGMGHIMPMKSISETFRKKYGDRVEVVESMFFTESNDPILLEFNDLLVSQVKMYNKSREYGYMNSILMHIFGPTVLSRSVMRGSVPGLYPAAMKHMESLRPDLVFSTHWATGYYARHLKNRPITFQYVPDATLNNFFEYPADYTLISMKMGYDLGMKKRKYNEENFKLVPFLIRNEAFEIKDDKQTLRKKLGLPEDHFTVVLAEGGYGIGKMTKICELLIKEHIPVTVVPVCGKNEELYQTFKSWKPVKEVCFRPVGFCDYMLELIASADLFCGKSGNMIAEPTFFGVPSIITNFATTIEEDIGKHYIEYVGSAMKEFDPEKVVAKIKEFMANPEKLKPYQEKARLNHANYGSERTADLIWEALGKRYPHLREN